MTQVSTFTSHHHGLRSRTAGHQRTLRVLHVINGEHYAGAARVQDLLALNLPHFGCDVSFVCVLPDQFPVQRCSHDSPLHVFPMRNRTDLRPARQVAALVRSEGFDLIHSHETRSAMIAAAAASLTKVPYVHHVHCQMNTEVGQRLRTMVNVAIERTACRMADRVIAISGSIRRFLHENNFEHTPITVVPNGVPDSVQHKSPRTPDEPWTIGMVALLRERKGLECLLAALPLLQSDQRTRLRIVGRFESPAYERQIFRLLHDLGIQDRVDFTGFTRNVNEELCRMDVLVLPSILPEGMPMVLLEAMAAGLPIVGSKVDGIVDVIRHGFNGLLFEAGNTEALAGQLNRILLNQLSWTALSEMARRDYEMNYSDRVMTSGVAEVYREVQQQQSQRKEI